MDIDSTDRITAKGCVVYEIHFNWMGIDRGVGTKEGGYSIRYVESEDTKQGREGAVEQALDSILEFLSEATLAKMDKAPIVSLCTKHPSWKWLKENRKLGTPRGPTAEPDGKVMRDEKRSKVVEDALDYLEDLGLA